MQGNRGADTRPEVALRSALHRLGLRFFKNRRPVKSIRHRADVVFPFGQVAVFVDGCFWHCCPEHGRNPAVNTGYWDPKLRRNVERDRAADTALADAGWAVVRIWEHEPLEAAITAVTAVLDPLYRPASPPDHL
jgi:DNA mismatch endonuclease, patch repair protein